MDRVTREALLVVRAQLGDRRALAELVGHWHDPVWRYVRRMLGRPDVADDVSQEVWARVLRALPRLNQPERFAPWLFTIARRSVFDRLAEKYGEADPFGDDVAVEDDVALVLDRLQLSEALAHLPPLEREVLILFHLQDFSLRDCAEVLATPTGTVKSRLFRARRLLRDRLVEKGYPS